MGVPDKEYSDMNYVRSSVTPRPSARIVLGSAQIRTRSGQSVLVALTVSYSLSDAETAAKAAILSVSWLDKDGVEIDAALAGFARSETYGLFRYIAAPLGRNVSHSEIELKTPLGATQVCVTLFQFTNRTLETIGFGLRRWSPG